MTQSQIVYIDLKLEKTRQQYARKEKVRNHYVLKAEGQVKDRDRAPFYRGTSEEGAVLPLSLPTYIQISTKASMEGKG